MSEFDDSPTTVWVHEMPSWLYGIAYAVKIDAFMSNDGVKQFNILIEIDSSYDELSMPSHLNAFLSKPEDM